MLIRLAQEDDAEQLAQAEYDTAASEEGLLAAKPHEIPISAFHTKIKQLRMHGLYVVMESQGELVGHLILEPLGLSATRHVSQLTVVVHTVVGLISHVLRGSFFINPFRTCVFTWRTRH